MAFWPRSQAKSPAGIADIRARYDALFARFGAPPAAMDFTPGQLGPIPGEWVGPTDVSRLMLYFHGGGFVAGSPQTHRPLVGKLVEASGVGAFSVQYRLAPECFFPAAVRDGIDAYRALLAKGVPAGAIVLAGDEAGGGLAFGVALAVRNAGLTRGGDPSGLGVLLFLPPRHSLRKTTPSATYASPAYAPFNGFPPVMVHAGAHEVLRDDASKLGDRAAEARVSVSVEIYDGMGHLFQTDGTRNEAKVSLSRLAQFVRARSAL